jgi:hypothetical protein
MLHISEGTKSLFLGPMYEAQQEPYINRLTLENLRVFVDSNFIERPGTYRNWLGFLVRCSLEGPPGQITVDRLEMVPLDKTYCKYEYCGLVPWSSSTMF